MRPWPALAVLLFALPAQAADAPLGADEFEALSTGHTFGYALGGEVYGAEQYLPGRKVLWAFKGDDCRRGVWYEEAGQICFVYDHDPAPQCWSYFRDASGLKAHFAGDPPEAEAATVSEMPDALVCPGPDVGV